MSADPLFLEEDWTDEVVLLPHSLDAEQAVLCALFQDVEAIHKIVDILKPQHFYSSAHQLIYEACLESYRAKTPIDNVSVSDVLLSHGQIESVGGRSYLIDLSTQLNINISVITSSENVRQWALIVIDCAKRREFIKLGYEILENAQDRGNKAYLEKTQSSLLAFTQDFTAEKKVSSSEMVDDALDTIKERLASPSGVTGLPTGFPTLDKKTHGLQQGNLIVLAARSGSGKTAMALNIATHVVLKEKKPVLFFSLEMTGNELMQRVLKSVAETTHDLEKLSKAGELIKQHKDLFLVQDDPTVTITQVQAKVQQTISTHQDLG